MLKLSILTATLVLTPVVALAQGNKDDQRGHKTISQGSSKQSLNGKTDKGQKAARNSNASLERGKDSRQGQRSPKRDADAKRDLSDRLGNGNGHVGADHRLRNVGFGDALHGKGLIDGCPPGLAKKYNGCRPPGQAAKSSWRRAEWYGYKSAERYRYQDGYLVHLGSGGNIIGYNPLLGGVLRIGNRWPDGQTSYALPYYHRKYYNLGSDSDYRSYANTVYRIDPQTSAIRSVAALLTGQDIAVGRPMPSGYDVYNVPYDYRSQYADGPTSAYRYSDGYVYQVDPETRLVQAAIELLT